MLTIEQIHTNDCVKDLVPHNIVRGHSECLSWSEWISPFTAWLSLQLNIAQFCNSRVWCSARWTGGAGQRRSPPAGPGWSWWAPVPLHPTTVGLGRSPPPCYPPPLARHGRARTPAPAAAPATHSTSWSGCRKRCGEEEIALFYNPKPACAGLCVMSGKYNHCPSNTTRF